MNQTSLLLTIHSMVLHRQFFLKLLGDCVMRKDYFPGLGIGMMIASFHDSTNYFSKYRLML